MLLQLYYDYYYNYYSYFLINQPSTVELFQAVQSLMKHEPYKQLKLLS